MPGVTFTQILGNQTLGKQNAGWDMDITKLAVFQMAKMRMDHSAQRMKVLSQNVANADTPKYQPKDIKDLDFRNLALSQENRVAQVRTHAGHLKPGLPDPGPYREVTNRYPYEATPDGNAVVLEEQMREIGSTKHQYGLALELVKKNLSMLRSAARGGR